VTFSLVACDPDRREWGVAVASKFLAVGAVVPFAAAETGAVATQALANVRFGPDALRVLGEGSSAEETLQRLIGGDPGRDDRQLGLVDRLGRSATYTGSACFDWAGGRTGPAYAAQGNILVSAGTVDALAETFEATAGTLADRLLAALAAGQAAGGDRRGQQSAALLVVAEAGGYAGGSDRLVDLRVDDHPAPIDELERLYELHRLYFGSTPPDEWLDVDEALAAELRERLARRGHTSGDLAADLEAWAGVENLEERVSGAKRIDPVVLEQLRAVTGRQGA
jgi:uncharacterized Ntn-hydrolase superfamily protein